MTDLFADLLRANLAASLAIGLVLALRLPARRVFGAEIAYRLWLIAPLAFVASLVPAAEAADAGGTSAPTFAALTPSTPLAVQVWIAGVIAVLALMSLGQQRFLNRARAGAAGPAVVGIISPRIVTPADHNERFTPEERALVRAHERAHIDRGDPRVNAGVALAQAVNWFNPLAHLAAYYVRLDQELACDATVMALRPGERRRYAETMLKTQLGTTLLPFGCYWPAPSRHPLEARIDMLKQPRPSLVRTMIGVGAVLALSGAAGLGAWASQPPAPAHVRWVDRPTREAMTQTRATVVMMTLTPAQMAAFKQPRR
ncbi:M56 family metallopeptidase [Phenylobacterium sp.]|uniref:M56 family metallopeptidase n=1 Tax=Phenylobacterium sp. TaxID=1871053 RepID=UPI00273496F5|nr:M56 family metallopeptidase [Phenylobacterium sp.]MDP3853889.1 M56 family metallopeptidase [Phenylobacterium sp.]